MQFKKKKKREPFLFGVISVIGHPMIFLKYWY
jgi:hypothetical protein